MMPPIGAHRRPKHVYIGTLAPNATAAIDRLRFLLKCNYLIAPRNGDG